MSEPCNGKSPLQYSDYAQEARDALDALKKDQEGV
jgi:hypothetical protein